MIDSSKKQQQGFPEILPVGDIEALKEKECLDTNSQKSLKEGQFSWLGVEMGKAEPCKILQIRNRFAMGKSDTQLFVWIDCWGINLCTTVILNGEKGWHFAILICCLPEE